jgi:hypothetical protein
MNFLTVYCCLLNFESKLSDSASALSECGFENPKNQVPIQLRIFPIFILPELPFIARLM